MATLHIVHKSIIDKKGGVTLVETRKALKRKVKAFCLPPKDEFMHVIDACGEHWAAKVVAPNTYETVAVVRNGVWL
jgi:hypothetical protein